MLKDTLKKLITWTKDQDYVDFAEKFFVKYDITSDIRLAHFFAQIKYESGNFVYTKELGSEKYLSRYEHRLDLGNTEDGDGIKYCGRGFIQLTGKANYKLFSDWSGIDVLNHPELLEDKKNAILSAIWFWNMRGLNKYADVDDAKTITKRINGGYNGLEVRKKYLLEYKKLLGI